MDLRRSDRIRIRTVRSGHARLVLLCAVIACAPRTRPPSPAPAPAGLSDAIVWSRRSAEHDALVNQTFRLAAGQLSELARDQKPGSWAVILDADETLLDNSIFEERRALRHEAYSENAWEDYVREEIATALPGAREFVQHARTLGGRIAVVTNRGAAVCAETRSNLRKLGLEPDVLLCRPADTGDKNPRFRAIQDGTADASLPPLRVLMWLGDNIEDFPALTPAIRTMPDTVYAHFGREFFILPNPMYGSWQKQQ